jgi:cytoskeletal protein RodZ
MVNAKVKRLATGLVLSGLVCAGPVLAQSALARQSTTQQSSKSSTTTPSTAKPATAKPTAAKSTTAAKKSPPKPLVYVEDDRSVKPADASASKTGDTSASKPVNASAKAGDTSASKSGVAPTKTSTGASASPKPLSADLTKAFAQNCPSVALTESKTKAAYEVMFGRDPGSKGVKTAFGLHKSNKIEVMSKTGKELFSESGHSTGQLVKDACTAIGTPGLKVAKN